LLDGLPADNVACWHETDMPTALRNVRSQGQSGKHMLALSFSAFDRSVAKVEN
jgi:hypothetical protein